MAPSTGGGDADGWSAQTEQAAQHEGGSDVRDAGGTDCEAAPEVLPVSLPWQPCRADRAVAVSKGHISQRKAITSKKNTCKEVACCTLCRLNAYKIQFFTLALFRACSTLGDKNEFY